MVALLVRKGGSRHTGLAALPHENIHIAHSHPNLAIFEIEDMKIQGEFNYVYCNENLAKQKIELFLNQIQTNI